MKLIVQYVYLLLTRQFSFFSHTDTFIFEVGKKWDLHFVTFFTLIDHFINDLLLFFILNPVDMGIFMVR